MPRRLPAGNGVVGHDEHAGPGRRTRLSTDARCEHRGRGLGAGPAVRQHLEAVRLDGPGPGPGDPGAGRKHKLRDIIRFVSSPLPLRLSS